MRNKKLCFAVFISLLLAIGTGLAIYFVSNKPYNHGGDKNKDSGDKGGDGRRKDSDSTEKRLLDDLNKRMNSSMDPCDDFYEYACGNWKNVVERPKDKTSWNGELQISEDISNELKRIMKTQTNEKQSETQKKLRIFYEDCMNINNIEESKGTWLAQLLFTGRFKDYHKTFPEDSGRWPLIDDDYKDSKLSVEARAGHLKNAFGVNTLLYPYVLGSELNSTENVLWLSSMMLPLGMSPMYFLSPDKTDVREAYSNLQKEVALLLLRDFKQKSSLNERDLHDLLKFEVNLAKLKTEIRDEDEAEEQTLEQINKEVPEFNWKDFLENLLSKNSFEAIKTKPKILLTSKNYIKQLSTFLKGTPDSHVQNYLIWRLVLAQLPYLSSKYQDAYHKFSIVINGKDIQKESQENICIKSIKGNFEVPSLGLATSELLLRNGFDKESVKETQKITKEIHEGLSSMISDSTWMDSETKQNAQKKLKYVIDLIGYPDIVNNETLLDEYYFDLQFNSNYPFGVLNVELQSWGTVQNLIKLEFPNSRDYFRGSPVRTNAWYMTETNSITIPLGEIFYPAIGKGFPKWASFGGLGSLIGHELSHGFYDPFGAMYDENGNLKDWWSKNSKSEFKKRQECLIDQFKGYCEGDMCIDGKKTLNENLTDLAGIIIALRAFKAEVNKQSALTDFSADQLFFLSYPIYFCSDSTDSDARLQFKTSHSPPRYRVNGILRNLPQFSEAFKCPLNSFMNLEVKCTL